jgi:hypothetical protein
MARDVGLGSSNLEYYWKDLFQLFFFNRRINFPLTTGKYKGSFFSFSSPLYHLPNPWPGPGNKCHRPRVFSNFLFMFRRDLDLTNRSMAFSFQLTLKSLWLIRMTTHFHILYLSPNKLRQIFGNYGYVYIYICWCMWSHDKNI